MRGGANLDSTIGEELPAVCTESLIHGPERILDSKEDNAISFSRLESDQMIVQREGAGEALFCLIELANRNANVLAK